MSGYPSKRAHHSGKRMMLVRGIVVLPAPVPELTRELGSRSRCSADHATCLCSLPSRGRCVRGAALFSGSARCDSCGWITYLGKGTSEWTQRPERNMADDQAR